jgi:hypothetical protein
MTIPTGNRKDYLADIIKDSGIPPERIVIVHTVESEPIPEVHNIWDLDEINIQRWWNKGIDYAAERGAEYVAVLNDDVKINNKRALETLAFGCQQSDVAMAVCVDLLNKNTLLRNSGHCFVLNLKYPIRPDERFRWWYGDNDLYMQATILNGIVGANVPIEHIEPNKLTSENPELMKLTEQDEIEYKTKWQELL